MMSLELGTLVNKYPDIQKDHLVALLYLRSDLKVIMTCPRPRIEHLDCLLAELPLEGYLLNIVAVC